MWERIGSSSGIMIGAVILFVLFTAILFIYERKSEKRPVRIQKKKSLYIGSSEKRNKAA